MILPLPRRTLPAALLLLLLGACAPEADRAEAPGAAQDGTLDLPTATAVSLARRLADGSLSAEALTRADLDRIARLDDAEDGPQLNAVVELNPEALAIARGLDEALAADGPVGPLHGLPVLLKANIDTGDAMATHAGSLALADHHASEDAHHVALLRQAGAVILGKTNLSEWANFRDSRSTSGWSSVGGQTRNPYVLDRNPCGSSSGSAVAVAASLAALAVGTETDGSIVCPAGINGIVGIKPTYGIVSRHGKRAKIYYASQVATDPPTIALFVNDPDLFDENFQRFLLNRMRDELPFSEVPIKLLIRGKAKMTAAERLAAKAD